MDFLYYHDNFRQLSRQQPSSLLIQLPDILSILEVVFRLEGARPFNRLGQAWRWESIRISKAANPNLFHIG